MQLLDKKKVQEIVQSFANKDVYIHLEVTNGAYTGVNDPAFLNAGGFIRNARIRFTQGKITGDGPYRIGLKMELGWVYGEGLTHYELDSNNQLLLAGLNQKGQLAVAFQISETPFE